MWQTVCVARNRSRCGAGDVPLTWLARGDAVCDKLGKAVVEATGGLLLRPGGTLQHAQGVGVVTHGCYFPRRGRLGVDSTRAATQGVCRRCYGRHTDVAKGSPCLGVARGAAQASTGPTSPRSSTLAVHSTVCGVENGENRRGPGAWRVEIRLGAEPGLGSAPPKRGVWRQEIQESIFQTSREKRAQPALKHHHGGFSGCHTRPIIMESWPWDVPMKIRNCWRNPLKQHTTRPKDRRCRNEFCRLLLGHLTYTGLTNRERELQGVAAQFVPPPCSSVTSTRSSAHGRF